LKRRQVVQILVIEFTGDLAKPPLHLGEIVRHPPRTYILKGETRLHLVTMAVQPLALAVVIPQEMRGIVMRPDVQDVHSGDDQRALRSERTETSTSGGCVTANRTARATSSGVNIVARGGRSSRE